MTGLPFDTLSTARRLREKGLSQEQAEAIADELRISSYVDFGHLATKEEMTAGFKAAKEETAAEFDKVRSEIKSEFALVRSESRELESRLDGKFKDVQIKLGTMIVALGGILIAIKYFG